MLGEVSTANTMSVPRSRYTVLRCRRTGPAAATTADRTAAQNSATLSPRAARSRKPGGGTEAPPQALSATGTAPPRFRRRETRNTAATASSASSASGRSRPITLLP